jgi:hypothetical protein
MKDMRHYINLLEARVDDPNVEYEDDPTKVTAHLGSYQSAKYTKLARNLQRIDDLSAEIKQLKAETKTQTREDVIELFDVEDAVLTRVVKTKSAIFKLTKDPKPTKTPDYKKILEEMEKVLTPELIKVLEVLKEEHVKITEKEPALSYELIKEQQTTSPAVEKVKRWLPKFDRVLTAVEQAIN